MTTQTQTPAPFLTPAVVTMTNEDMARLARQLYSNEVQGSRLDLMAYDTDRTRQAYWLAEAERRCDAEVARYQAAGQDVEYRRVRTAKIS